MIRFLFFHIFFNSFILASPAILEEDLRFANVTILDFDEQAVSFEDLQRTHVSTIKSVDLITSFS